MVVGTQAPKELGTLRGADGAEGLQVLTGRRRSSRLWVLAVPPSLLRSRHTAFFTHAQPRALFTHPNRTRPSERRGTRPARCARLHAPPERARSTRVKWVGAHAS